MALLLLAACSHGSPPNVIVIVIDTLRADRVGWYDGNRQLTPFLDSLAKHGVVFRNAYAQSSWTAPSVASLWTSRYQSQHGVILSDFVLPDRELTLPEVLKEHSYLTIGCTANPVLTRESGFAQGFDDYEVLGEMSFRRWNPVQAGTLNHACLASLDALESTHPSMPVFLYLQYMDPHWPYAYRQDILDRALDHAVTRDQVAASLKRLFKNPTLWNEPDAATLPSIESLYDNTVAHLDDELRTWFATLRQRGLLANSVVIITADHGEEFLDHGHTGHGHTLYNELIHVPLLVLAPGQISPGEVSDIVSLVDLAPTVLDLLHLPAQPSFEGRSLIGVLQRQRLGTRLIAIVKGLLGRPPIVPTAYSELMAAHVMTPAPHQERAIIVGSHKLIIGPQSEGFDIAADPAELHPDALAVAERDRLAQILEGIKQRISRSVVRSEHRELDAEARERMRALGYAN